MKKLSLVLFCSFICLATVVAQRTITGTVTDDEGEALIGATVLIQGTSTGVVTNIDGAYSLQVPEGGTLIFSYTGFVTQEVNLGASNVLDVTMQTNVEALDEMVVIAYGQQSRKKLVQSVATVANGNYRNTISIDFFIYP